MPLILDPSTSLTNLSTFQNNCPYSYKEIEKKDFEDLTHEHLIHHRNQKIDEKCHLCAVEVSIRNDPFPKLEDLTGHPVSKYALKLALFIQSGLTTAYGIFQEEQKNSSHRPL